MPPSLVPSTAFVYTGPGAGSRSVHSAVESLRRALKPTLLVNTLTTDQLLQGEWTHQCRMLVMPGGADVPYCRHLNGPGNTLISNFVQHQGGTYLGLCAGAYYGCSRVEFELGSEIEVVGDRELGFYPGVARGSIYKGFDYQSEQGAIAAPIRFRSSFRKLSNSGGSTNNSSSEEDGVVWEECKDYLNGGPGFLQHGANLVSSSAPSKKNRKSGDGVFGGGGGRDINNDINFLTLTSPVPENLEILATFTDHNDAAAAVVCHVGLGRAVLCSTHPELAPEWLGLPVGAGRSDAVLSSVDLGNKTHITTGSTSDGSNGEGHVELLMRELKEHEQGRWRYWKMLLVAAGLEDFLID